MDPATTSLLHSLCLESSFPPYINTFSPTNQSKNKSKNFFLIKKMANTIGNISQNPIAAAALAAALLLFVAPLASTAGVAIPASKGEVDRWFSANVGNVASRKSTLDPELVAAEAAPKVIKVSQSGGGEFKTVGEAVKSVPSGNKNRVIIKIAAGTYQEKVDIPKDKPFITLVGEPGKTTLVAASTAAQTGTVLSAVLYVQSDYFMMYNMIVKVSSEKIRLINLLYLVAKGWLSGE